MGWSSALKSLCEAAAAYLFLRSKTFYADLHYKSYDKQDEYIKEIEKLRIERNPASADIINTLLLRLQQERSRLNDLSTYYNKTNSRPID